jgi:hypothetical protein
LREDALQSRLAAVYRRLAPLLDFFIPTMKLESKVKVGSKEIKKYDAPCSRTNVSWNRRCCRPG